MPPCPAGLHRIKKPAPKGRQAGARDLTDRTERATGGDHWSCCVIDGINIVECESFPARLGERNQSARNVWRHFLTAAFVVRNIALRQRQCVGKGALRKAKPGANFKDLVHVAQNSAASYACQEHRSNGSVIAKQEGPQPTSASDWRFFCATERSQLLTAITSRAIVNPMPQHNAAASRTTTTGGSKWSKSVSSAHVCAFLDVSKASPSSTLAEKSRLLPTQTEPK